MRVSNSIITSPHSGPSTNFFIQNWVNNCTSFLPNSVNFFTNCAYPVSMLNRIIKFGQATSMTNPTLPIFFLMIIEMNSDQFVLNCERFITNSAVFLLGMQQGFNCLSCPETDWNELCLIYPNLCTNFYKVYTYTLFWRYIGFSSRIEPPPSPLIFP